MIKISWSFKDFSYSSLFFCWTLRVHQENFSVLPSSSVLAAGGEFWFCLFPLLICWEEGKQEPEHPGEREPRTSSLTSTTHPNWSQNITAETRPRNSGGTTKEQSLPSGTVGPPAELWWKPKTEEPAGLRPGQTRTTEEPAPVRWVWTWISGGLSSGQKVWGSPGTLPWEWSVSLWAPPLKLSEDEEPEVSISCRRSLDLQTGILSECEAEKGESSPLNSHFELQLQFIFWRFYISLASGSGIWDAAEEQKQKH